jgi:hypothetical protein
MEHEAMEAEIGASGEFIRRYGIGSSIRPRSRGGIGSSWAAIAAFGTS